MRTQVGIIGGGPSGLLLARLLGLAGIDSVVLERRTPEYLRARIRAGLLEQGTVDLLNEIGVGARLDRERLIHDGVELAFDGRRHRIDLKALSGKSVTIYGQAEIQNDLMDAHEAAGTPIVYEAEDVSLHGLTGETPHLRYTQGRRAATSIACDFIAGCDGFHGVSRQAIPQDVLRIYEKVYPFGWLGILSETPPVNHELIYTNHERGFALCTMRSLTRSRYYLQVSADEDAGRLVRRPLLDRAEAAPAAGRRRRASSPAHRSRRAWRRCARSWPSRCATAACSWPAMPPTSCRPPAPRASTSPPPTCASWPRRWSPTTRPAAPQLLDGYSAKCLARVWKAQRFSWWMTSLTHRFPEASPFERRAQAAELAYITSSKAGQTTLAENYVGLPFE